MGRPEVCSRPLDCYPGFVTNSRPEKNWLTLLEPPKASDVAPAQGGGAGRDSAWMWPPQWMRSRGVQSPISRRRVGPPSTHSLAGCPWAREQPSGPKVRMDPPAQGRNHTLESLGNPAGIPATQDALAENVGMDSKVKSRGQGWMHRGAGKLNPRVCLSPSSYSASSESTRRSI